MVEGRENLTAASAAYLNIALEPTRNSLCSCVASAIARGSPWAFGVLVCSFNRKVAKALGLTIAPAVLYQANWLIH
jgi:hypothetical protein